MIFPVSGVEVNPLIPPLIALVVSTFTSMGGVSGAFLLLPFQVSVLNFTSPAVSPTNLVYNIVAIPSGVYRFIREGRMNWPVAGRHHPGHPAGTLVRGLDSQGLVAESPPLQALRGLRALVYRPAPAL